MATAEPEPGVGAEPEPGVGAEPEPGVGAEPEPGVGSVEDPLFGAIRWQLDASRLRLDGAAVPVVDLRRTGGGRVAHIPIGTRRREHLAMTVDGRAVDLRPGPGRMSRRSYRVVVGELLLTPSGPTTARLVWGRSYRGDNELGVFESLPDASVSCAWSGEVDAMGVTLPAASPTPAEAATGYALALAFGTGARFFFPALLTSIDRLLPG